MSWNSAYAVMQIVTAIGMGLQRASWKNESTTPQIEDAKSNDSQRPARRW